MNPDNNALARTYFIGGAPRVGKTILSLELAKQIRGNFVSTDSIRDAAKKASADPNSDLFIINRMKQIQTEEDWLHDHRDMPSTAIEYQNRESVALWPSIVSFCNTFCENSAIHVMEGVALLPSLVARLEHKPEHVFYVGNTSDKHVESMLSFARENPQWDWMGASNWSEERIRAMAVFVKAMSLHFKTEADKHGFKYYELEDGDFQESVARVIKSVLSESKP